MTALPAKQVRIFGRPISPALAGRPGKCPGPAPFRSAQFEGITPNLRSISTRFVFAEVKASAMQRVFNEESGEGLMAEVELTRSAVHRACERTLDRFARRRGWVGLDLNIGRSPHTPWRAVKEAKASIPSPAWPPGRRGCPLGRGAQPCLHSPPRSPAQPKRASSSRGGRVLNPAGGWVLNRAILGAGEEMPMSPIALVVGTVSEILFASQSTSQPNNPTTHNRLNTPTEENR